MTTQQIVNQWNQEQTEREQVDLFLTAMALMTESAYSDTLPTLNTLDELIASGSFNTIGVELREAAERLKGYIEDLQTSIATDNEVLKLCELSGWTVS